MNHLGFFALGLAVGLIDETWYIPHGQCYQFPYITFLGCMPSDIAREVAILFFLASVATIVLFHHEGKN